MKSTIYKVWVTRNGTSYSGLIEARSVAQCLAALDALFPGHDSKTVVVL